MVCGETLNKTHLDVCMKIIFEVVFFFYLMNHTQLLSFTLDYSTL